jgi:hypothetical protein
MPPNHTEKKIYFSKKIPPGIIHSKTAGKREFFFISLYHLSKIK